MYPLASFQGHSQIYLTAVEKTHSCKIYRLGIPRYLFLSVFAAKYYQVTLPLQERVLSQQIPLGSLDYFPSWEFRVKPWD